MTLNLAAGNNVTEIEVFEIQLNTRSIDEAVLRQIAALQKKIRREKQFNKQVEMNAELKKLKAQLNSI